VVFFKKRFSSAGCGYISLVSLLLVTNGFSSSASAYDWNGDYGASLTVGIEDNYRLSTDNEVDTNSTAIGLFGNIRGATEISQVGLTLNARDKTFSESSIDDERSYTLALDTSRTGERFFSNLDVAFDSDSTTETELLDSGDNRDGTRDTVSISPGMGYQLNERNSLSANLSHRNVNYDKVSLTEYKNNSVSLSWNSQLAETRNVSFSFVHSVYDPDEGDTTDTDSLSVGYRFQTSEVTTYGLTIGITRVEEPQESEESGTGSFTIDHRADERNNFTLTLGTSYAGSGQGSVRKEDRINLRWNHGLSDLAQTTVSAEGVSTDDREYYTFTAGVNYNYTREVNLSANYRFRIREESEFDDDANSNSLFLTVSYSPL
jgi:hypothetical protein